MSRVGAIALFCLLVVVTSSVQGGAGPLDLHCLRVCQCDVVSPPRGRNHTVVKCQRLPSFPEAVPPGTTVLDLHDNDIKEITANSLTQDNLEYLRDFDCSNGKITGVDVYSFRNVSHLKVINLSSNKITKLSPTVFADLKHLTLVDLRGNPGLDCNTLKISLPTVTFLCDDVERTSPETSTSPGARESTSPRARESTATKAGEISTSEAGEISTSETGEISTSEAGEISTLEAGEISTSETGEISTSEAGEFSTSEISEVPRTIMEKEIVDGMTTTVEPTTDDMTFPFPVYKVVVVVVGLIAVVAVAVGGFLYYKRLLPCQRKDGQGDTDYAGRVVYTGVSVTESPKPFPKFSKCS